MADFKTIYNPRLVRTLARHLVRVWPEFPAVDFVAQATRGLDELELKARVDHLARALHRYLPASYPAAVSVILAALPPALPDRPGSMSVDQTRVWMVWPLCRYVARYGLQDLETSAAALRALTQRFSCEFAVRPFLARYPDEMYALFGDWVRDESPHVRRLVSEGTRPYLPWGRRLPPAATDPARTLPLLKALRNDSSSYVRRSVVNHLNDLSRLSPDLVVEVLADWENSGWDCAPQLKPKALRTLLRDNHPRALAALGLHPPVVLLQNIRLDPTTITIGEAVHFSCAVLNQATHPQYLRIDYVLDYPGKKAGTRRRRVFALRKVTLGTTSLLLSKTHTFGDKTTRTHYPGEHRVSLRINGVEFLLGVVNLRRSGRGAGQDDYASAHTRYSRLN